MFTNINLFIHVFIQQIVEHLLCVQHCANGQIYSDDIPSCPTERL